MNCINLYYNRFMSGTFLSKNMGVLPSKHSCFRRKTSEFSEKNSRVFLHNFELFFNLQRVAGVFYLDNPRSFCTIRRIRAV